MTSYNQKRYLREAIESVLGQTLRPHEIIVADNGSRDGSIERIKEYVLNHPDLVRPLFQPGNVGISRNKNEALKRVEGDLVTILDGDDRFLPRKLEMEFRTYQAHREPRIVHSNYYFIDPDGGRTAVWCSGRLTPPIGYVFREVFARDYLQGADLFRNELLPVGFLETTGLFDERLPIYEDWELRIRLTKRFLTSYCPEPLVEYRLHPGGVSRSPASVHLDAVRLIYETNRDLLAELNEKDRTFVEKSLYEMLARLSRRASREAMDAARRRSAFEYWVEAVRHDPNRVEWPLVARLALPTILYAAFRSAYRVLRGRMSSPREPSAG
ncbi:MAG: glycosyltransferase [Chloroflexi bacterium]|nr:glycosyltransferase [Chloroflexota bacterium]